MNKRAKKLNTITKTGAGVDFKLRVVLIREGVAIVAYVPALDLTTHGDSEDDAVQAAQEAAAAFLDELSKMNTLEDILLDLGWQKDGESEAFPYTPPEVIHAARSVHVQCHA
ncbi:MAG TPA: hypothetical protein DF383_04450, partial [Deltaproteobacteria bacterium]|nr:hypothetical protein [Deltaproteobacteria bacterium]